MIYYLNQVTVPATFRRVEDKLDAKGLVSEMLHLRYQVAPSTKKVKLTYPAWLIMSSGCEDSNVWSNSQLMSDRTRGWSGYSKVDLAHSLSDDYEFRTGLAPVQNTFLKQKTLETKVTLICWLDKGAPEICYLGCQSPSTQCQRPLRVYHMHQKDKGQLVDPIISQRNAIYIQINLRSKNYEVPLNKKVVTKYTYLESNL